MTANDPPPLIDDVACPFCGMLCDDLRARIGEGAVEITERGCARSVALFRAASVREAAARIGGNVANLDDALEHAAETLRMSARPLFLCAGADVGAARAMIELAEHCRGGLDHENGRAMARNLRVMRDTGWISTTLTEVRNRADLLVVAGTDVARLFPRFFERCFGSFDTLFDTAPRELWFLGAVPAGLPAALRASAHSIAVEPARLAETFSGLRALLAGRTLSTDSIGEASIAQLNALLARMRAARYGVLAWAAAELDFPHADLAVQSMCEFVAALNESGRFCVLPLGGTDGDLTLQQVSTWQTGFPGCITFSDGTPTPATHRYDADTIVYVSTLDPDRAPAPSAVPTIVLGHPGMRPPRCEVFIPVGVPGVHHAGHLYRADNVVAVPLKKLAGAPLPSAADVMRRLHGRLRGAA